MHVPPSRNKRKKRRLKSYTILELYRALDDIDLFVSERCALSYLLACFHSRVRTPKLDEGPIYRSSDVYEAT